MADLTTVLGGAFVASHHHKDYSASPTTIESVRHALTFVQAHELDSQDWLAVCMAIHSEYPNEAGFELCDSWSAQDPDRYDAANLRAKWRGFKSGRGVTIATLFNMAKQGGYRPQAAYTAPRIDPEVLAQQAMARAAQQAQADADKLAKAQAAALVAKGVWDAAKPCPVDHPYLVAKGVQAHGTRIDASGALIVPMTDLTTGALCCYQRITADGDKKFHGPSAGTGFLFGEVTEGNPLVICEGFSTSASAFEATGHAVLMAGSSGALKEAARAMHAKHPETIIIFGADDDYDKAINTGMVAAHEAAQTVNGLVAMPDFGTDRPDGANDFNDLHQLKGAGAVVACFDNAQSPSLPKEEKLTDAPPADASEGEEVPGEEPPDEGKKSQSSQLVKFVQEQAELFHDENRDTYATVKVTQETYRLLGSKFKSWLMAAFSTATGKTGRDQSVREALCTLDGLALHYSEQKTVHVRVALHDGAYFVDLGQLGNSLAVKIEAGQWQVVATHEVRFIRPDSMRPLPTPMQGGDIHQLWNFVNVPEDARLLVLTWLCECLRPDTEFPVLELVGEAGTAKSTTQKYLRMLIDPNASNLRSPPKSVEDVFVGAGCSWITSYENVSHLTPALQDALCTLATGGGYATRKHYTNNEESVINVMRPTVLNGISASVTAHDLIDRSISVEPQLIKLRRQGAEIGREFDAIYPQLVGALFQLMAQTLECLPRADLPKEDRPRMTSFAYLGIAVQMALGYPQGEFMRQFHLSRMESVSRTIDGSPVAAALLEWFEARGKRAVQMSIKELLAEVETHKPQFTDAWPRSPKGFGDALRRAAPSLRYMGIEVLSLGKIGGAVKWAVRNLESGGYLMFQCPASPASPADMVKTNKKQDLNGHEQDLQDIQDIETINIPRTSDFPSQEAKGLPYIRAISEKVDFLDGEEF